MRDFLLVFKTLYRNANVRKVDASGKRKISQKIVMFIVCVPLILIFCVMLGMLVYVNVTTIAQLSQIITAIVVIGQLAALFFGLYGVINTLYSGDDRALLNSLPLKPSAVFMAKFALSYVRLLKITSLIILPFGLTASITYAALGREMFYAFFALIFVLAAIAPILPLAIITLFSLPISYIGSYLKGHAVLKSVLSIIIYVAIFGGYMFAMFAFNSSSTGNAEAESGSDASFSGAFNGLAALGKAVYPSRVAVECSLGINGWVNFGITAGITVGLIALTTLLAALFYKRISQRSLEAGADKSRRTEMSFKQSGLISALVKRDFMSIIRTPQMAMSSFANLLAAPLFIVIMYFAVIKNMAAEPSSDGVNMSLLSEMLGISLAFFFTSIYLGTANMLAAQAFSREGKAYCLNRTLPIPETQQVRAKLALAISACSVAVIIEFVLVMALYKTSFVNALMFMICSEMCAVGGIGLSVYADARYGNANWTTRQELQQSAGGMHRLLITLACMVVPIIALIVGCVLGGVGLAVGLSSTLIYVIFWCICGVLSAAFMAIGLCVALKLAAKYLANFGERKYIARKNSLFGRGSGGSGGFLPPRGGLMR